MPRLTRNFHDTFIPERRYISAILEYAAADRKGNIIKIGSETGIPTGASSGKVPATLNYAVGMGLISLEAQKPLSIKKPILTDFGRIVYLNDKFLIEAITQWGCQLNLCSSLHGADVWYYIFFKAQLGIEFKKDSAYDFLRGIYGTAKVQSIISPLFRMYSENSSFKTCAAIEVDEETITRNSTPINSEFVDLYSAWILQNMETSFPRQTQIVLPELDERTGWKTIPNWNISDVNNVLSMLERNQAIRIDRQMQPWLIMPQNKSIFYWNKLYSQLI